MGPRTKKSPTSPAGKLNDVEPQMEAPEGGSTTILPPDDLAARFPNYAVLGATIWEAGYPGQDHLLVCLDCGATTTADGFCHNASEIALTAPVLRALDAISAEFAIDRDRLAHGLLSLGMASLRRGGPLVAGLAIGLVEEVEDGILRASRAGACS
ncbi:MAG: hypothetical protein ACYC4P_07185 [Thermoanaerobaculia bacterium]